MSERVAGRELDAEIAEKVMGWPYDLCRPFEGTGVRENRDGTISEFCVKCGRPHGSHDGWPHYSNYIAAAWEVVEKFKAAGVWFSVECNVVGDEWEADIRTVRGDDADVIRLGVAFANTAPLAICLAALQAIDTCV